jgi:glucose-6-phosphate 1-dehydrogenase
MTVSPCFTNVTPLRRAFLRFQNCPIVFVASSSHSRSDSSANSSTALKNLTAFGFVPSPDAYEIFLWDVMKNDATLFMRADQVAVARRTAVNPHVIYVVPPARRRQAVRCWRRLPVAAA